MIDRLAIYLLLAGCLIFGAIILMELEPGVGDEPTLSEVSRRPDVSPAVHRQPGARPDELLATALARPLFSSTRRPPQSAASDGASSSDLADMRLTGIVTEPGHRLAIFAVKGAKPLRVTEGEAVSGWRIESITPREVSLSGPGGTKTLEPKVDPNLVPPAQAALPAANAAGRPPPVPAPAAAIQPRPGIPPAARPLPAQPPRAGRR
jgi:general secretion pathway protein N